MSIKEFFKPDWRKIVIFIFLAFILGNLLFLISTHFFTAPHSDCRGCQTPEFLRILIQIFEPLGLSIFNYIDLDIQAGFLRTFIISVIGLLDIIFWYFISCFIFWLFSRFKKKPS